ncbi:MAG: argininosuccinate lyase, partial [Candidatus Dormibacteria bacterium]
FNADAMRHAASDPDLIATDIAEHLVQRGVPFRRAHEIVGGMVATTRQTGRTLADVSLEEWREVAPHADATLLSLMDPTTALERRATAGGPGAASGAAQIRDATARIEQTRETLRREAR